MSENQLNQQFARFFGQITAHFDKQFTELRSEMHELHGQVDNVRNTVDGIAGDLITEREERAAMNHQLDRHEDWIKQLADGTNTKLVPEP